MGDRGFSGRERDPSKQNTHINLFTHDPTTLSHKTPSLSSSVAPQILWMVYVYTYAGRDNDIHSYRIQDLGCPPSWRQLGRARHSKCVGSDDVSAQTTGRPVPVRLALSPLGDAGQGMCGPLANCHTPFHSTGASYSL